ncbi:hypothetical protein A6857_27875, partial [Salmonella enterica]|nr:hypothetical protein [Salmonella enterica]
MNQWKKTSLWVAVTAALPGLCVATEYNVQEGSTRTVNGGTEISTLYVIDGTAGAQTTIEYQGFPHRSRIELGPGTIGVRDEAYTTHVKSNEIMDSLRITSTEKRIAAHKRPNNLLISASIKEITNTNDSYITINDKYRVEAIRSEPGYFMSVYNHGETHLIDNAYNIVNYGVMRNFQNADDVTNKTNGIIAPTNTSTTKSLLNEGRININNHNFILSGKDGETFANDVNGEIHATGDGRLVITTAGRTGASNWGKIILERDDGIGPMILRTPEGTKGNITLYNVGTITSPKNAITIDGTQTGEGTVATIFNEGNINGGITTTPIRGDKATVTLNNKAQGVWYGDFQDKEYIGRATTNKFVLINNDGTIKTKGNEKNERGIIHSVLTINGGTIDIRDGSLTLDGDYEGRTGGQIHTSGVLGGDETELPNLQITGKVAGDATLVTIDNLGGTGAATQEGIAVVRAKSVDGEGFVKKGRIVAGAYDYDLVRIEGGDYTEWRLTSEAS